MQTILFKDLAQLRADLAHFDILIDGK